MTTTQPLHPVTAAQHLLPGDEPFAFVAADGTEAHPEVGGPGDGIRRPDDATLLDLHRRMVVGRRLDTQCTALTKQGRLAVYPSSAGQEACEIGVTAALRDQDWLFPTYRDTVAVLDRGVPVADALELLRGSWHCGYDPYAHRVAPQCTPLATNTLHAVGLAHAARLRGEDTVAVVFVGDGATSEGDTHEAFNVAAVWKAPVVFVVVNNGFAISVPLAKQTAAPSLAAKGIGYGMPGRRVDGNDVAAVHASVRAAIESAVAGEGPTLIEAMTYRMQAHTNADDATRYRTEADVEAWRDRDPVQRSTAYLTARGVLTETVAADISAEAEARAAELRDVMNADPVLDPALLFEHVLSEPTPALHAQAADVAEFVA
ncbi:thiamine pyrophosphate-dependent enzyme [Jatrophihabitans sp. YIM 134969]